MRFNIGNLMTSFPEVFDVMPTGIFHVGVVSVKAGETFSVLNE